MNKPTQNTMKLWYNKPAENWEEALPLGNGRLGGMVFGNVYSERIQLNEDSVWYGGPMDRNNPDAASNLQRIRSLISEGKMKEAEELSVLALSGTPEGQRHYEPLGDLYLFFRNEKGSVTDYYRELDLETGTVRVEYCLEGVHYKREIFTSYPHGAMVIRLTADQSGAISLHTQLSRGTAPWNYEPFNTHKFRYNGGFNAYVDKSYAISPDSSVMAGQCGGNEAISFASMLKIQTEGGCVSTLGNSVIVEGADAVTLLLTANTTYREADPVKACMGQTESLAALSYQELYQAHCKDYGILFSRVQLHINDNTGIEDSDKSCLPTDVRLERMKKGEEDIGLINLFFQYGRYLLIASSRPGALPANLQGIWNKDMLPAWDSKYTININTQMNYWPAETCNLSECHLPLFDHLERMRVNGRKTASIMYGCRGFMAHHNTDIWADTAPQDVCLSSTYWVMGAAWLCLHLWEHYEFTKDLEFLKESYNTMKEAAEFIIDFLIEDGNGNLVTSPTLSPENEYRLPNGETAVICMGASMDNQIIHALFNACMKASVILETDKEFREEMIRVSAKVPEMKIGKYGQIMEWTQDYEEIDPGHRHISHLFALHPGNQISVEKTPDLAEAAKKTLKRRLENGGGHTGWSRAWIINMWARLEEGEKAYQNILELLRNSTLPNLFDNHPPFQIDGNFGCSAGIAEMLLQSHQEEIHILPALPSAWKEGYVKGLKSRGGYEIDISWKEGNAYEIKIRAAYDGKIRIKIKDKTEEFNALAGMTYILDNKLQCISTY